MCRQFMNPVPLQAIVYRLRSNYLVYLGPKRPGNRSKKMRYERDQWLELERQAHHDRAVYIAGLLTDGYNWVAQLVSKAWRSSSSSGTNSSALS